MHECIARAQSQSPRLTSRFSEQSRHSPDAAVEIPPWQHHRVARSEPLSHELGGWKRHLPEPFDAGAPGQGAEAGGHGVARGTFALVPAVVDVARGIPVAAAGGVADGRGLAAALMLGAEGVLAGTRFYATQESAAMTAGKERVVAGSGDNTARGILLDIVRQNVWPAPYSIRVLRNAFFDRWRGREAELLQHLPEEAARYDKAREPATSIPRR